MLAWVTAKNVRILFFRHSVDLVFCCVHCVPSETWASRCLDCLVMFVICILLGIVKFCSLPISSPSAHHTHSDDICVQHRPVQPSSNGHVVISDDMYSFSLVLTFGTACCRLCPPSPHILHSVEHWKLTFINFHFFPAFILLIVLCIDYVMHSRSIIVQMCAINVFI